MERVLPRPLDLSWAPLRWALVAVGIALAILNAWWLVRHQLPFMFHPESGWDFYHSLSHEVRGPNPYEGTAYVWSPVAVYPLDLITPLGFRAWQVLNAAAILLIRPWKVAGLVALSYPFWFDIGSGNLVVAVFAVTWCAAQGQRWAVWTFLVLTVLMPRPLMLPTLVWLLWQRPEIRWPFAGIVLVHGLAVMATGLGDEWLAVLIAHGPSQVAENPYNLSPSAWLGMAWMPFAVALAAWATWRGHLGIASLAASPYWMHNYLIFAFLELVRPARRGSPSPARSMVRSAIPRPTR